MIVKDVLIGEFFPICSVHLTTEYSNIYVVFPCEFGVASPKITYKITYIKPKSYENLYIFESKLN